MDTSLFEKFNEMMDVNGLKEDIEAAASNNTTFEEVPFGDYEVKVVKLELGETGQNSKNPGMPKMSVWFEIVAGDFKNQKIFMNQNLTTGFGIHMAQEFLNSLESGIPVVFEDYVQFGELLEEIFNVIDGKAEYQLAYSQNKKGFSTYTIVQRF